MSNEILPPSVHTPAPWRFEYNGIAKALTLKGGRNCDLTIFDVFKGKLRFRNNSNLMDPVKVFASVVPGREHHASWFMGLTHADAQLIEAAPLLLAALKATLKDFEEYNLFENSPLKIMIEEAIKSAEPCKQAG